MYKKRQKKGIGLIEKIDLARGANSVKIDKNGLNSLSLMCLVNRLNSWKSSQSQKGTYTILTPRHLGILFGLRSEAYRTSDGQYITDKKKIKEMTESGNVLTPEFESDEVYAVNLNEILSPEQQREVAAYLRRTPISIEVCMVGPEEKSGPNDFNEFSNTTKDFRFSYYSRKIKEIRVIENFFRIHYIKKKNGGYRRIVAYAPYLLDILERLLGVLGPMMEPTFPTILKGCVTGESIPKIANHLQQSTPMGPHTMVGHVDIRRWFDSIWAKDVEVVLSPYLGSYPNVKNDMINTATIISEICCARGRLPQGSPMSALLANGVAAVTWAPDLEKYTKQHGIGCTVYVDDIAIAVNGTYQECHVHLKAIQAILDKHGFESHKVYIRPPYKQQKFLGVIVNRDEPTPHYGPRVPKRLKREIRAILHRGEMLKKEKKNRFPIIFDWVTKHEGGHTLTRLSSPPWSVEEKLWLRKKFFQWIIGTIGWIGQFDRDASLAQEFREKAKRLFDPRKQL